MCSPFRLTFFIFCIFKNRKHLKFQGWSDLTGVQKNGEMSLKVNIVWWDVFNTLKKDYNWAHDDCSTWGHGDHKLQLIQTENLQGTESHSLNWGTVNESIS